MTTALETLEVFFGSHFWTIHVASTLLITFLAQLMATRIVNKLSKEAKQKSLLYPEALLHALSTPVIVLIWLIGIYIAANISFPNQQDFWLFGYLLPLKKAGFIITLTWAVIRFIRKMEVLTISQANRKRNKNLDETMVHAFALLLSITTTVISGLAVMQLFGLPISGLLAFGGIGGAAVAFASKDLLANFFGGLVVYLDKPFKVGHWIRSPDKDIEGTVEHIGWRVTRLRTLNKRALYVPNSFFLNISVENATRMLNRRIKTYIGVRYQDAAKINDIIQAIDNMLKSHPEIDTKLNSMAFLAEFGPSSLDIIIDAFTKATKRAEYHAVRHDIFIQILKIIEAHGAECAFPTQTVYLEYQDGP